MRRAPARSGDDQGGFSLVELLTVISILGVVGFALTEAVILGLKTTDSITTDVTRTVAVQALRSHFTSDVQQAEQVFDPPESDSCATTSSKAFLHLSWTDAGTTQDVAYSLEDDGEPVAGQQELVRWSCTAGGQPQKRMLGRIEMDPVVPVAAPVAAFCDNSPCLGTPTSPDIVKLKLLPRPKDRTGTTAIELTVRRRVP